MNLLKNFAAAALMGTCVCAFALTSPVSVNGKTISTNTQERLIKQIVQTGQKRTPELENQVRMQLIQREILLQEADRLKIPARADVKDAINNARSQVIIQALLNDYAQKTKVTDQQVKDFYDQQKASYGDSEYKLAFISVKTDKEAKEALSQLKTKSFETVAKSMSLDENTKSKGGHLDQWVSASRFPSPVSYAIQNLKKGEYNTVPVRVGTGYHIIKLLDVRKAQLFPKYETSKAHFKNLLINSMVQAQIQELLQKAVIK